MHSSTAPSGITYRHNGDFSGDVIIPNDVITPNDVIITSDTETDDLCIVIPAQDILFLAGEIIRQRKTRALEQADTNQILGVENS